MPVLSIRNLPAETHRALKIRAARNGRSTEAEVRAILVGAVEPASHAAIGTELAAFAAASGGIDIAASRSPVAVEPAGFE